MIFVRIEVWISIVDFNIPPGISPNKVSFVPSNLKISFGLHLQSPHERKNYQAFIRCFVNYQNCEFSRIFLPVKSFIFIP